MKHRICITILTFLVTFVLIIFNYCYKPPVAYGQTKIGVMFMVHGGMDTNNEQNIWDTGTQQFSYDPNHSVYKLVIWNPALWSLVMTVESSVKFQRKFDFEYPQIGGVDPFHAISDTQLADMKTELDLNPYGIIFEVDWAAWMAADIEHYPYPRFMYYGPDGPGMGSNMTYCGEDEPGGAWPGCDPNRYDVDGPLVRLLNKGVKRIIAVDLTVGGVRFGKTFDVVKMLQLRLDEWNEDNGTSIPLTWVNDYSTLMERSYPLVPEYWTRSLGLPDVDNHELLNGSPNPVSSDPDLATLQREAIETGMSGTVSDALTGVIIMNHALHDNNEVFDPKIDDTLILNENIKSQLLANHPTMDSDNIIGAYMGIKAENPDNGLVERTRKMRGEALGYAWLYESDKELPGEEWGYRYWEALEYLKNQGVQHIVIGFPQIITSSVLDMVEFPNQIGKEIGKKNWAKWGTWDYTTYPVAGHPFADYWGNWVDTDCEEWELNYDGGTSDFTGGTTLTGQVSEATGVIKWMTGDVTAGTITLKEISGTFQDDEIITDDGSGSAFANGTATMTSKPECCFVMGGCSDPLRPYPPSRHTPLNEALLDMDPSLAYDLSDYGHLGYDPDNGDPDPNSPVQDQYTGTWAMYSPPDDDPRVGQMLASHVLKAAINPMVYITSGNLSGVGLGESVTFEAHVVGGTPPYSYEWSTNKDDIGWSVVTGETNSTWTWTPGSGDGGIYDIRCSVTDSQTRTGEVTWEGFVITDDEMTTTTTALSGPCPSEDIYGEHSAETELLRQIRDNILNNSPEGQEIIRLYYEWSPVIVKAMEEDEAFKEGIKELTDEILLLLAEEVKK